MNFKDIERIVSFDLSLTAPGWAIWTEDTGIHYGLINVKDLKGWARLDLIKANVLDLVFPNDIESTLKTLILIEGYSFNSKGNSAIDLGELGGIIRMIFWEQEIPFIEVPPTQAKKFLTGVGKGSKSVIIKEVYKNYSIDVDDDNIADACNIAMIGRAIIDQPIKKLTKDQEKIVADLKKVVVCQN